MLISLVITLSPQADVQVPFTVGRGLHAAFLGLVAQRDEALAAQLHAPERAKPFSISPLYGNWTRQNGSIILKKEQSYWFRITSLEPSLSALLADVEPGTLPALTLFEHRLSVRSIAKDRTEHAWAARNSVEELYQHRVLDTAPPRTLTLEFSSPTTFRSRGENFPFPLPRLVFLALAEKWNRHAPVHLGEDIAEVLAERVLLTRYDLKTRLLEFDRYRQIGFIGRCTFRVKTQPDEVWNRIPHLLADFAFYAGVGYKTTMGMGQVRPLSENREKVG